MQEASSVQSETWRSALAVRALALKDVATIGTVFMPAAAASKRIDSLSVVRAMKARRTKNLLASSIHEARSGGALRLSHADSNEAAAAAACVALADNLSV